jgi:two-component system, OmpR family, phosphate regulon sensor histidine kinase PhoR
MRLRIHHALFVGFLGVIGLLVTHALTLVLVGSGLNRELSATFEAELERQLRLGVALMERSSGMAADELARLITARIDYRVTIIDTSGAVLGESYVDSARVRDIENHLSRPEVRGVVERGERVSFSERSSATVGDPLLYGATLGTLDGVPVVLRMGAPRVEIERAVDRVQRAVAVAGMLAMMVALVAAYLLSKVFARPLVALADRARRLAKGDFSGRAPQSGVSELRDVAVAFNRLSDELRARLTELGEERDEMQVLIDCMAEGVVALSEDGRLMRTNRTARALLHLPEMTAHPPIGAVVRHPALRESLEGSLDGDGPAKEMELSGRHLLVSSRTLDHGGAVTTLLDITEIRRLEAVRRDFVANASHELKTPLTSIRGYAEALIESDPPEELRGAFWRPSTGTRCVSNTSSTIFSISRGWSPADGARGRSVCRSTRWRRRRGTWSLRVLPATRATSMSRARRVPWPTVRDSSRSSETCSRTRCGTPRTEDASTWTCPRLPPAS